MHGSPRRILLHKFPSKLDIGVLNGVRVVNIGSKVVAIPNKTTNPQRMVT